MQTTFTKLIEMQFERAGKRTKLAGFIGEIRDESGILIHSQSYATRPEAEQALDSLVHELLIDYAARGLVDTLPVADVNWNSGPVACAYRGCVQDRTHDDTGFCCYHNESETGCRCDCTDDDYADAAWESDHGSYNGKVPSDFTQIDPATAYTAQSLANRIQSPAYVVMQHGHCLIQDDADLDCYGGRADIVATYQPLPQTLDSLLSAQTQGLCVNCGGAHRTWQCNEIRQALFAEDTSWKDIALGRELCRMRWHNFTGFVALLLSVPAEHLTIYAASYLAFMQSYGPTDLTVQTVLKVWIRMMAESGERGPSAPALQAA